jgi:acyl transferase domain-containing protein
LQFLEVFKTWVLEATPLSMASPPQINPPCQAQALNPHCDLENFPSFIPSESTMDLAASGASSSGLSSFGFGGTNSHVVLEDSSAPEEAVEELPGFKRQSFAWQQRHLLRERCFPGSMET